MDNNQKKLGFLFDKLKSNHFKHGSLATIFTVIFVALVIVLNIVVSTLSQRFPSMNIDLTAQKLNTLSETSIETAKNVENPTEIYFIGSEEVIKGDKLFMNYGLKYSQVANLAEKMQETNNKVAIKYIDPDLNPTFIAEHQSDKLTPGMILVKTDKRSKVLDVTDLFSVQQNQQDGTTKQFSKADGALSNALHLVNLTDVPVVAVATGHDEMLSTDNRTTLDKLLTDNAFEIKEFNILTEEIPAEAKLLFIGTPSTDYTKDEISKIQKFLADTSAGVTRSLVITCHPTQGKLPNLATLLEEWGVKVNEGIIIESDATKALSNNPSYFFSNATDAIFKDTTYPNLLTAYSSPLELTFTTNNDISTYALVETNESAYISVDQQLQENPTTGKYITSTLSQKYTTVDDKSIKTNVIVLGDTVTFSADILGGSSFGNRQYVTDIAKYATGTTDLNTGLSIAETETNVVDITAPAAVIHFVGLILFTIIIPVVILIAGLVIFLRRRHL